jgi:hypothetical protein
MQIGPAFTEANYTQALIEIGHLIASTLFAGPRTDKGWKR